MRVKNLFKQIASIALAGAMLFTSADLSSVVAYAKDISVTKITQTEYEGSDTNTQYGTHIFVSPLTHSKISPIWVELNNNNITFADISGNGTEVYVLGTQSSYAYQFISRNNTDGTITVGTNYQDDNNSPRDKYTIKAGGKTYQAYCIEPGKAAVSSGETASDILDYLPDDA